jgi:radical SAM protein with 4Fe4S-binding SPASM domain
MVAEAGNVTLPPTALLELTYACNHECKFCYCPWDSPKGSSFCYEKQEELSVEDWKKALHILEDNGVLFVGLSGGEPLLKDGIAEILRYIRSDTKLNRKRAITVITNGAALDEKYLSLFKEVGAHLSFSLPGLNTFAWHTGSNTNTAGNVLYWLKRCKEEKISTALNVTATKRNLSELYEIIANGLIAGARSLLLNRFMVGGRGISYQDELNLSQEEVRQALDIAEEVLEAAGRRGHLGIEVPPCILEEGGAKYKQLHLDSLCAAATRLFIIDPSGHLRVCNHSPRRIGYIFGERLVSDIDYWGQYADKSIALPAMCDGCQYRQRCNCGCREAAALCHGSLSAPDPIFR